jgi:hypothetical protein
MSVSEFRRRINKSCENFYSIYTRKTMDTGLLSSISKVLEHDFFQYYNSIASELQFLKDENETLKEMVVFLKAKKNKSK